MPKSALNTAPEGDDGWNTDSNFIKFQELFDRLHSHPAQQHKYVTMPTTYHQPEGAVPYSEAPAVNVRFVCSVNERFPASHQA